MFQTCCCWGWCQVLLPPWHLPRVPRGAGGSAVVPAEHPLPSGSARANFHLSRAVAAAVPGPVCSVLSSCSSQQSRSSLCSFLCLCSAARPLLAARVPSPPEELEKPGDARCPPLSGFWMTGLFILGSCSWVQSVVKEQTEHFVPRYYSGALELALFPDGFLLFLSDLASLFWHAEPTPKTYTLDPAKLSF